MKENKVARAIQDMVNKELGIKVGYQYCLTLVRNNWSEPDRKNHTNETFASHIFLKYQEEMRPRKNYS